MEKFCCDVKVCFFLWEIFTVKDMMPWIIYTKTLLMKFLCNYYNILWWDEGCAENEKRDVGKVKNFVI